LPVVGVGGGGHRLDRADAGPGGKVTLDASYKGTGHRYLIEFVGRLAGQDIGRTGMISEARTFSYLALNDGSGGGEPEVQSLLIKPQGAGSYTLTLNYNGRDYTTTSVNYGANAATLRYALNTALGAVGTVEVAGTQSSGFTVTFGGALLGQNLSPLKVTLSDAQVAPGGSFTLTLSGQTTRNISYSSDGAALAAACTALWLARPARESCETALQRARPASCALRCALANAAPQAAATACWAPWATRRSCASPACLKPPAARRVRRCRRRMRLGLTRRPCLRYTPKRSSPTPAEA
jgi:hypothetical protein